MDDCRLEMPFKRAVYFALCLWPELFIVTIVYYVYTPMYVAAYVAYAAAAGALHKHVPHAWRD